MTNYELMKNMSIEEMAVTLMCPKGVRHHRGRHRFGGNGADSGA